MTLAPVALVTLLLLAQYVFFAMMVGKARVASGLKAPAMTGDATFERASRVHLNTLEQLAIALPAMWICGAFFRPDVAAVLGLVFLTGRFVYRAGYMRDPRKRGPGMMIGFLASAAMILTGLWGVGRQMLG